MNRTDLAMEAAEALADKRGARIVTRTIGGIKVTDLRAAEGGFGKPSGRYITLEGEPFSQGMTALLRRALEQLLPRGGVILAAGLGNPDVIYDSFGALTVRGLLAGRGQRHTLAAIETDIALRTGIETAALVRAAARELGAECVVAFDSLACRSPHRIGRAVQITDAGITPGSGVGGDRKELSSATVGVRTVVVGVPLMAELSSLTRRDADSGYAVTSGDVSVVVRLWAEAAAEALNELVRANPPKK